MLIMSMFVMKYMLLSKVKFINMIQLEFMFMLLTIMSMYFGLTLFLMIIMLSGVGSIIFMLLYIKSFLATSLMKNMILS